MRPATDPSRFCCALAAIALAILAAPPAHATDRPPLKVCAEPDNLPFSNAQHEGFENKIAALLAAELGRALVTVWQTPGPDVARAALDAGQCDAVMGIPSPSEAIGSTRPYYWSSYVLVSRADRDLDVVSLKDHRLRQLRIGVEAPLGGRLYTPPARVLAELGLDDNMIGFPVGAAAPRGKIVDALVSGDIDVAAAWGPAIGYFARHSPVKLRLKPIGDTSEFSARKNHFGLQAMQYEIAVGVRPNDTALRHALDAAVARKRPEIEALLERYGVPLIAPDRLAAVE